MDTGPLVALIRPDDVHHVWATAQFAKLSAPFFTCEPVLVETYFLLSRQSNGGRLFFELLASGLLQIEFSVIEEQSALAKLVHKYRDLPMSLADACLVRMAEQHPGTVILTVDSHFRIYRKNGRQAIDAIMP